jgi:hypothetical protein
MTIQRSAGKCVPTISDQVSAVSSPAYWREHAGQERYLAPSASDSHASSIYHPCVSIANAVSAVSDFNLPQPVSNGLKLIGNLLGDGILMHDLGAAVRADEDDLQFGLKLSRTDMVDMPAHRAGNISPIISLHAFGPSLRSIAASTAALRTAGLASGSFSWRRAVKGTLNQDGQLRRLLEPYAHLFSLWACDRPLTESLSALAGRQFRNA